MLLLQTTMISFQALMAIAMIVTQTTAVSTHTTTSAHPKTSTTSAPKSCSTAFDAAVSFVSLSKRGTIQPSHKSQYDDITVVPIGGSANVPTPYLDLNYVGWTIANAIEVANETVSTLQTSSPPNTIFFNGNDDTGVHSFSVA